MPENCLFTDKTQYDIPTLREFIRGCHLTSARNMISRILMALFVCLFLWLMQESSTHVIILVASIFYAASLIKYYVDLHTGGTAYKRLLSNNRGSPPTNVLCFTETEILSYNEAGDYQSSNLYNQVLHVTETKNLYILMLQYRQGIPVRKDTLEGGNGEDFLAFLRQHCHNWKSKKCRRGVLGKMVESLWIAAAAVLLLLSLCNLLGIPLYDRLTGRLGNDVSYSAMADSLEKVDIHISKQTVEEITEYDKAYYWDEGQYYYADSPDYYKVLDLLYWEGCGVWDEAAQKWTPSTSGVYYLDAEVWNVETMYTDFFAGLSAMDPELLFTNVTENYSGADLEAGTGTVEISFEYNGTLHQLTAEYDYDWFDMDVITEVARILARDDSTQELFACPDGQGLLFYYGTEEQVRQLRHMTTLEFTMVLFLNEE